MKAARVLSQLPLTRKINVCPATKCIRSSSSPFYQTIRCNTDSTLPSSTVSSQTTTDHATQTQTTDKDYLWTEKNGEKYLDTQTLFKNQLNPAEIEISMKRYKTEVRALAQWLDLAAIKRKGKTYDLMKTIVPEAQGIPFPEIDCYMVQKLVEGQKEVFYFPSGLAAAGEEHPPGPKVLTFAFKQSGSDMVKDWMAALTALAEEENQKQQGKHFQRFELPPMYQIHFIEYSFLSMAKRHFAKALIASLPKIQHSRTFYRFGRISEFATSLLLPSIFSGYVFLLDGQNRIRWLANGQHTSEEISLLKKAIEDLRREEKQQHQKKSKSGSNSSNNNKDKEKK